MNNWIEKRVFISGGAGVIGTALVTQLLEAGATLLVGDLKPEPDAWKGKLNYREGDLISLSEEELIQFDPEIYIHLAATFERSDETQDFWEENFQHNITLSHHLLTIVKDLPSLKKILFASSYLIYNPSLYLFSQPQLQPTLLKESSEISPRNLCGMAKLLHEKELEFVKHFHPHLQIISTRIFRSYGKNSRDIISRWIKTLLNQETIKVYCPEGRFDYIYADDVAIGLVKLLESHYSGVVNLGNGQTRSIAEVVNILKSCFSNLRITYDTHSLGYESSQANTQLFDHITKINKFRSLEEIIPELVVFYKNQNSTNY